MAKKLSRLKQARTDTRAPLSEKAFLSYTGLPKLHKFLHFWLLVWKSFSRNRCPVRASALAYATLLALIPMLAVVMSITSSFLKKEGEERIDQLIVKFVSTITPAEVSNTNTFAGPISLTGETTGESGVTNAAADFAGAAGTREEIKASALSSFAEAEPGVKARRAIARNINEFVQNTRSGPLGVTGSVLLIFVAISMLSRIEETFNDMWGVARGRSWFMRGVLYWGVLSLVPILVVVAVGLAKGRHLEWTKELLTTMPGIGGFVFQLLPVVILCAAFALFYMLIPNTKVHWRAAFAGGAVSGTLFHLNNAVSVLYFSRVVSNSRIYGSLGLILVFMIGLYLSWLILLFGAQVAYAFQNRAIYFEEKQVENVNQRGREFIALRLMTCLCWRFRQGESPPTIVDISEALSVPTRLIQQIMQTLVAARLVVETAGGEAAYLPARPLESITCHDVLFAMRAGQGQELDTRDEPARNEVYGEFQRIQEAERQAATSVTMLALVDRTQAQVQDQNMKALAGPPGRSVRVPRATLRTYHD